MQGKGIMEGGEQLNIGPAVNMCSELCKSQHFEGRESRIKFLE